MASTAVRPLGEAGSGGTTFSYAQAAKGRATSATTATVQTSQPTSGTSTPPKDMNLLADTSSAIVTGTGNYEGDRGGNANGDAGSKGSAAEADLKPIAAIAPKSSPSSPSIGADSASTLAKEDEAALTSKLSADIAWDRFPQSEVIADKSLEAIERRKGRKSKKDKNTDKEAEPEKEEVKPEVFVAAPPPAINIWQQRAEAAKAKAITATVESSQTSSDDTNLNGNSITSASKTTDPKRKVKLGLEDFDRVATSGMSNTKEQILSTKIPKKGLEINGRSKEESNVRRSAPRGSRISDKEDKVAAKHLPPPVEDATSWPTPDTALEEKRKVQEKVEKEEKEDSNSNKPRPKEKWVTVPYTPSVTFATPLPLRGGRGRGGGGARGGSGRGGHAANGSISGDKTFNSTSASSNTGNEFRDRGRDNVSLGRATSLPPNASKRATGDASYVPQDQRKPSISTFEKPRTDFHGPLARCENPSIKDNRRSSIAAHTEPSSAIEPRQSVSDTGKPIKPEISNGIVSEGQPQSRSVGSERRSEPNLRANEFSKESNGHGQTRERGEGRLERGRGGYRGRGSHANFPNGQPHNQHTFNNGHAPQSQNAYGGRQNPGPYSPPLQQPQYNTAYPAPSRAGRGGPPRSQSIPTTSSMYARFSPNGASATHQIPPIQTVSPVLDYPAMQTMSAVPYASYMEPFSVLAMVTMQLEYYFSIDNLCKDVFLRKHMDSKGFVFLSTIANFKRIQSLTQEFELLRFACQESEVIDIVMGEDGIDRLRRKDGWEQWVLAMEERDEIAKNDGPERYYRQQSQRLQPIMPRIMPTSHSAVSPLTFSPNGTEPSFRSYANAILGTNGVEHPIVYHIESPLSAAVPDFSPNPPYNQTQDLEAETTFTDEEVEKLQLVYNHKGPEDIKPKAVMHSPSSRTFSNGSIDGRMISEELLEHHKRQGRSLTNGDSPTSELSPEKLRRPKSPFAMSPTKVLFGNAPPVMWVKGQQDQAPVTESNKNEPYSVVRARALRHRESSGPGETDGDMKLLYQFWSHFLVRNFNPRMYEEFRTCAIEDAQIRQDIFGMSNLIQYYDEVLNSKKKTMPEILAKHYVDLVNAEDRSRERPGFSKLRAAWRNGALDMKSRKRVDNFVDARLREELER